MNDKEERPVHLLKFKMETYWLLNVFFVLFLTLKLTGVVTWSWWLVTAPLWMPLAGTILVILVSAVFVAAASTLLGK